MSAPKPVLIMAGGTGGHIFPGLAVAEALRARGVPVVWLGAEGGMETKVVPAHGIELVTVPVGGLRGKGLKTRLLANGREADAERGLSMPKHHRHLVVLENTSAVQNVICCTLCSCTAFTIIGLPPDWYKDLEYRSRVVRESRTVLREMGLDLAPEVEIKVWDTTADTRYMVLPEQPPETIGWSEEKLASIVSRDAMIGVARL